MLVWRRSRALRVLASPQGASGRIPMHCKRQFLATTAVVFVGSRNNGGGGGVQALVSTSLRGHSSFSAATAATAGVDFVVTLERASHCDAEDEALWNSGVFDAQVHPDLPPAWTVAELVRHSMRRAKEAVLGIPGTARTSGAGGGAETTQTGGTSTEPSADADDGGARSARDGGGGDYLVRTVPVQMSRRKELRRRLAAAAGVDSEGVLVEGGRAADALLLVSGSHPGRRLPLMRRLLPDVYDELRLATSMRESGHLPKHVAFWAVANPLTEADEKGVERVRKKVGLGAEVIVTQPPLVWEPFERWLRGFHATGALAGGGSASDHEAEMPRRSVETIRAFREDPGCVGEERHARRPSASDVAGGGAKVLVGIPMITSPKGLHFWLHLCGVSDNRSVCRQAFEAFGHPPWKEAIATGIRESSALRSGPGEVSLSPPYGQAWFDTTISRLKSLEDAGLIVSGVHVMAPGAGPRRRASELARRGDFGAPRRPPGSGAHVGNPHSRQE